MYLLQWVVCVFPVSFCPTAASLKDLCVLRAIDFLCTFEVRLSAPLRSKGSLWCKWRKCTKLGPDFFGQLSQHLSHHVQRPWYVYSQLEDLTMSKKPLEVISHCLNKIQFIVYVQKWSVRSIFLWWQRIKWQSVTISFPLIYCFFTAHNLIASFSHIQMNANVVLRNRRYPFHWGNFWHELTDKHKSKFLPKC